MALVQPPALTGWGGLWNTSTVGVAAGQYRPMFFRSNEIHRAAVALGKRGFRKHKAVMRALNGVAPGATTTDSYKRVAAVRTLDDPGSQGGRRSIETVNNAVTTTTAHRDAINTRLYDWTSNNMTYPVDRGGNGGGNKLTTR